MNEILTWVAESLPRAIAVGGITAVALLAGAWLCSIVWAWSDLQSRDASPLASVALLLPVILLGALAIPLYLAARPLRREADARATSRYLDVLVQRIAERGRCACGTAARPDWIYCPTCTLAIQAVCADCGAAGPLGWQACAYCGSDEGRPVPMVPAETPVSLPAPATPEPAWAPTPVAATTPSAAGHPVAARAN